MSNQSELAQLAGVFSGSALSNRNMVVNGGMTVAQRAVSVTGVTGQAYHCCDRFQSVINALGTWTVTQEADGPSGFANSLKYECTTADASPAAGDYIFITQSLEGLNVQQIAKGTADAKPLTLSFWVKSNVTGTYCVYLLDQDNSRGVGGTYSVSASGTWEYKTISLPADTTGAFTNDSNKSLQIEFWLDSGTDFTSGTTPSAWEAQDNTDRNGSSTVNLGDTIGNYWQITGVQLEIGDTSTPFEHEPYSVTLQKCQRYYYSNTSTSQFYATQYVDTYKFVQWGHPVRMRATPTPTVTYFTGSFSPYQIDDQHFKAYVASSYTDGTTYYTTSYAMDAEL